MARPTEYPPDGAEFWAPLMVEWATIEALDHQEAARAYAALGDGQRRQLAAERVAFYAEAAWTAKHALERRELTAAELEAPAELVAFVSWLRGKLGVYLPRVPVQVWQAVGTLLHGYSRRSQP